MKKSWKVFWITSGAIALVGVLFLLFGVVLGGTFAEIELGLPHIFPFHHTTVKHTTMLTGEEERFTGIKNLDIDVDHMSVYLKHSQNGEVCVGTEDVDERANLRVYQEGESLNIETNLESSRINNAGTIILYFPDKINFHEIDISVGAGILSSELQIVHVESADISVAAGSVEIEGIEAEEMHLECGVGSAMITLGGQKEDYNYNIECGMGEVEIEEGEYSGIGVDQQIDYGASKDLNIECGMGSVAIRFRNRLE